MATLVLAACAGPRSSDLLAERPAASDAGIAARYDIFVATTRAKSPNPRVVYDGQRSMDTTFASVNISVPKVHEIGQIERPRGRTADPSRFFTAHSIAPYADLDAFAASVAATARQRGGRAMVFVHGYNTGFDSAVYRATQVAHDTNYEGAVVLFSWASGGRAIDYVYDRDSATAARDGLEYTLRALARHGVKRVDIVAHSMGTWLAMESLRQLAATGDGDLGSRLGDVILASPDIDVDVFKTQMRRYGKPGKPFFVLLSGNDRALRLSGLIAGQQPRLGEYRRAGDIAALGVIVVDLTEVQSGDRLNHSKFADNPLLVQMLGDRLREGDSLGSGERELTDRFGLLARGIGGTLGSAAEIIITTPANVLNVVVGGAAQ